MPPDIIGTRRGILGVIFFRSTEEEQTSRVTGDRPRPFLGFFRFTRRVVLLPA
jgi:hypothetical protein